MTSIDTRNRSDGETVLALRKLDKRFGATHALKAVDLTFDQGEIHAIVGENGAGKSTLIKLLTGVHPRSSGEILWRGAPVALATPHEAINPASTPSTRRSSFARTSQWPRIFFSVTRKCARGFSTTSGWCATGRSCWTTWEVRFAGLRNSLILDHRSAAARRAPSACGSGSPARISSSPRKIFAAAVRCTQGQPVGGRR